jgi:hypothetical protein
MRRYFLILSGVVAVGLAVFAGSYLLAQRICTQHVVNPTDDLAWLRQEFRLSDAEMARIRKLHEGYLPKCHAMCERIAVKKRELAEALVGATNVTTIAEQKLAELGALRTDCQVEMLRHFAEVGQAMPAEQGRRYFDKMRQLTLGSHERVEASMSGPASQSHGH